MDYTAATMSTLRIRLASPSDPDAPSPWWRTDSAGRVSDRGVGAPTAWPPADRTELMLGADTVRIVALSLPPVPEARRPAAVAYALEDQLAERAEDLRIFAPAPRPGRPVVARVVDRSTLEWIAARVPPIGRVIAEPDLVDDDGMWHWCADAQGRGFVRRDDGSAFATGASGGAGRLPAELEAALAEAARRGRVPDPVIVDATVPVDGLMHASGARFVAGIPWAPEQRPDAAWSRAPDLLAAPRDGAQDARPAGGRAFVPAIAWLVAALAVQVVATLALAAQEWVVVWRTDREVVEVARASGIDAPDATAAAAALARRAAQAAHGAGRSTDADLLPLLARASPVLAALPSGGVRRIAYADGRLTADLAGVDDGRANRLVRELSQAGLKPMSAPIAGGARVAVSAGP